MSADPVLKLDQVVTDSTGGLHASKRYCWPLGPLPTPQHASASALLQHWALRLLQAPTAAATAPADMKWRLSAMLADPNMRLPDLAAELVQLGGLPAGEGQQKAMEAALNRMLVRSGGAFKALSTGMTAALQMALLAGPAGKRLVC